MVKLWLDDLRPAPQGWKWAKTYEEAVEMLVKNEVTVASLDHDLGYGLLPDDAPGEWYAGGFVPDAKYDPTLRTGYDLVRWMVQADIWPTEALGVHSANITGATNMCATIERYGPYDARDRITYEHSPCGGWRYRKSGEND